MIGQLIQLRLKGPEFEEVKRTAQEQGLSLAGEIRRRIILSVPPPQRTDYRLVEAIEAVVEAAKREDASITLTATRPGLSITASHTFEEGANG